jgi:hypothetical protein
MFPVMGICAVVFAQENQKNVEEITREEKLQRMKELRQRKDEV